LRSLVCRTGDGDGRREDEERRDRELHGAIVVSRA
jgi:hypothetical protein